MFMYFFKDFLENLLPSILVILFYIFFIIIEIIISIVIIIKTQKGKRVYIFFKAISIIVLSILIFIFMGTPNPKLDIKEKLKQNELIGKWNLTHVINKIYKNNNYIELNENGLCKFNSIDYNSSKYISSNCQWVLEHNIEADNYLYEDNVIIIMLDKSLDKRYFYFKRQGKELILYNYYLNDWYRKIEYKRRN